MNSPRAPHACTGGIDEGLTGMPKRTDIKDPALAEQGIKRIEWAWQEMPVLRELHRRVERDRPLHGIPVTSPAL